MQDFRLIENRKEAFIRWAHWSIVYDDCDPAIYMARYLFDRYEHNIEQVLWICWLYGTTYHLPTAWVIWQEFPDFELVDQGRLEDWNNENYKRLRYQTDTKWNKGHLPAQFASYRKWVHADGSTSQRERFAKLIGDNDPKDAFKIVWDEISNNLHKFGRYSTFFYLQFLKQVADLKIDAPDLILGDVSGSKSHRNGLVYVLGEESSRLNIGLDSKDLLRYNDEAAKMLKEIKNRLPEELKHKADYFALETVLCAWKKLFRKSRGRYLGYYLDRQAEEIEKVEADGWYGIDWKPLWDARRETIDHQSDLLTGRIDKGKMEEFLDFGTMKRLHFLYNDVQTYTNNDLVQFFT